MVLISLVVDIDGKDNTLAIIFWVLIGNVEIIVEFVISLVDRLTDDCIVVSEIYGTWYEYSVDDYIVVSEIEDA